jgi:hypothetical protein
MAFGNAEHQNRIVVVRRVRDADDPKHDLVAHGDRQLGQLVELVYSRVDADGSLREARFA